MVAELDYNSHPKSRRYEVRLVDIRPAAIAPNSTANSSSDAENRSEQLALQGVQDNLESWLIDRRQGALPINGRHDASGKEDANTTLMIDRCPTLWSDFQLWQHQAQQSHQPLALTYSSPVEKNPVDTWTMLLGLAKFLSRSDQSVSRERLAEKLGVCDRTLELGLIALTKTGFVIKRSAIDLRMRDRDATKVAEAERSAALSRFLAAVQEEHFRRQYFSRAPVSALQSAIQNNSRLEKR